MEGNFSGNFPQELRIGASLWEFRIITVQEIGNKITVVE